MAETIPAGSTTDGVIQVGQPTDARVSAPASYDVADFPVPHGREEDWRFTPWSGCAVSMTARLSPTAASRSR